MSEPVTLILGAGPGLGAALTRRFAAEGRIVCPVRRELPALDPLVESVRADGGRALPYAADATDEGQVADLFGRVEREAGPIETVIFNPSRLIRAPLAELAAEDFEAAWRATAWAGFLAGREAARVMVPRGRGTVLFTGATASVRGGANFAAFASGKFALRGLAQSMARELAPKGVHVAHLVIDGVIDTPRTRGFIENAEDKAREHRLLDPHAVAESFAAIADQPPSAWTFEADLRPWAETW